MLTFGIQNLGEAGDFLGYNLLGQFRAEVRQGITRS